MARHAGKVFCVGRNKTGTTSIEQGLGALGYRFSVQNQGERLLDDWMRRDFSRIVELARGADAGQDIPYSLPYTYQALDAAFPGSKFILTLRDSPQQWYDSLLRFHAQLMKCGERRPTAADLKKLNYLSPGWLYRAQCAIYGVDDEHLYDPEIYMRHYAVHAYNVTEYFRFRPHQLLVLNLADPEAMQKLCNFLGIDFQGQGMPHLNRSM
jgi:Sulfotransferase domain